MGTKASTTHTLGIIADTHGLLRPEAVLALGGVERILHAGDIGSPEVLDTLSAIAPVTAIRGNVDRGAWADDIPDTEAMEVGTAWLYMLHNLADLDLDPRGSFAAIISGHSHKPAMVERDGVLYFNPGSAGPRRFKLPVCVGRLIVSAGRVRGELIELAV